MAKLRYISTAVLVALIGTVLFAPATDSGQPTCAWCRKAITSGQYYQIDGRYYHETCYRNHVLPKCAVCNRPIEGRYITANGKNYHENCYNTRVAMRCDLCNAVINGQYHTTFWGEVYCAQHQGKTPECTYCGRYIGDRHNRGGKEYSDGRQVCNICLKTAVNDEREGRRIMERVRGILARYDIDVDILAIPLHLVDRNELSRAYGKDMHDHSGFCQHDFIKSGDRILDQHFQIYVLAGMPKMHFVATIAHELMHVWQYRNSPPDNQLEFCEGSCNYAAWLVLSNYSGAEASYQMRVLEQNDNPVYGEGFRRVKQLADNRGRSGWLSTLQSHKRLPKGY